ncbi:MAG: carbohydrate ABC transporter permease [Phycisphaerales bacterium]|jgi:ABC-type glycerol-3-phosphate transport system permease component|nr:carbohydrate ABC transporter permease [Phycisphaerales bacterium]
MSTTNTIQPGQSTEPASIPPDAAEMEKLLNRPPADRRRSRALKNYFSVSLLHLVLGAISLVMVLPFVWMLLTSIKPLGEVGSTNWIPSTVDTVQKAGVPVPRNYVDVFDYNNPDINHRGIQFARFYWNSIFVAAWATFLQVMTSAMAAYSFARLKWPGRDRMFLLYLSTMMLPGLVMMIPNFQIMISMGLVDTFTGLIVPAAFSAFGTFLMRQFMLSIPQSLDEAAEIDGAGKWRLFWDIILPLSRPGLITLTIFTFMGNYNSFFWPLVMLRSEAKYTLPIGLLFFDSSQGQATHLLMAAVTMSVVPMIVLFVLLQKYLVKGIQLGAVKG